MGQQEEVGGIRLEYPHQERLVEGYLVVLVYHPCSKLGNIKYYWPENI